ncbi:MAG: Rpn family recombination-promoting nuclease/putative transposase [Clostridiales bacterium]|jgi:predicted transposase/invertase (TIGR01784 family)|nr:Rpn family recombination-promoting nuclease/putative transposase [Clostridiales bacterium]
MREEILKILTREEVEYYTNLGLNLDSDLLDPKIDSVFKAIFTTGSDESSIALTSFLSAATGREITSVSVRNNELARLGLIEKQTVFDVHVNFGKGDNADIEMQMWLNDDLEVRAEYNLASLFCSQQTKGRDYRQLNESYTIFVLNQILFHDTSEFFDKYVYTGLNGRRLKGRTAMIFIELSKLEEILKKPVYKMTAMERWAIFLKYVNVRKKRGIIYEIMKYEEGIRMAVKVLENISRDYDERIAHYYRLKQERDRESQLIYAKTQGIAEGKTLGISEGRTLGISEGKTLGISEGKTLGISESKITHAVSIVRKLGISVPQAAEILELDASQRVKLEAELQKLNISPEE